MSNETTITIAGNLVDDPDLQFTTVSRGFRITEEPFAANPRVAVPCGRVRMPGLTNRRAGGAPGVGDLRDARTRLVSARLANRIR